MSSVEVDGARGSRDGRWRWFTERGSGRERKRWWLGRRRRKWVWLSRPKSQILVGGRERSGPGERAARHRGQQQVPCDAARAKRERPSERRSATDRNFDRAVRRRRMLEADERWHSGWPGSPRSRPEGAWHRRPAQHRPSSGGGGMCKRRGRARRDRSCVGAVEFLGR